MPEDNPRSDSRRKGRRGFAAWMVVTAALLVPSQWLAYSHAMRPPRDGVFPISQWDDARYFTTQPAAARSLEPLSASIIEAALDAKPVASPSSGTTPRPRPRESASPAPTEIVEPTPGPTGTPTPTPTVTPTPKRAPAIEMRADVIAAPDGSDDLFYRWKIEVANPADGEWLDVAEIVSQVPVGTERVQCRRLGSFAAPSTYQCSPITPPASEDGHNLVWSEDAIGPGQARTYSFDVRVKAEDGARIRDHAHLFWRSRSRSVTSEECVIVVSRHAPKSCRASSADQQ